MGDHQQTEALPPVGARPLAQRLRSHWSPARALVCVAFGALTGYTVALALGFWSHPHIDWPTGLTENVELWPKSTGAAGASSESAAAPVTTYWQPLTMKGFGRRIDSVTESVGTILEHRSDAGGDHARFKQQHPGGVDQGWYWVDLAKAPPAGLEALQVIQVLPTITGVRALVSSSGWPMLCTTGWHATAVGGETNIGVLHTGDTVFPDWVPLVPMPLGLAVNALVYAPLWYLLFTARRRAIQRRRQRRGLCRWCRYPVSQLPRCPECGGATEG